MRTSDTYIFTDFETTSKNKHTCQPTEIAAQAIDARKLEVIGEFRSLIKVNEDPEYCKKYNLDPPTDEVLKMTHIDKKELMAAPEPKVVWKNFGDFVNQYNYKKNKWGAPIFAGFNINYDLPITDRLCGHDPYKFGPYDDEYRCNALFNPVHKIDLMDIVYFWFSGRNEPASLSFDSLRAYFGMDNAKAHSALYDVKQGTELLVRFIKLTRKLADKTKFKGVAAEW